MTNPIQPRRGAKNPWFVIARPVPRPRVRLLCFPHAGGSAAIFRAWSDGLPLDVEVLAVQLPGRGTRLAEPLFTRMEPLLTALEQNLAPILDCPFALFGHSMGARVAFELARRIRRRGGPLPVHLFVSACLPPGAVDPDPPLHPLPDRAFIEAVRRYGGMPEEVYRSQDLLSLLVPILRADIAVVETCEDTPEPPLSVPITALGGRGDIRLPEADLMGWRAQTESRFALHMLPGDHFFLQGAEGAILSLISAALAPSPARPADPR